MVSREQLERLRDLYALKRTKLIGQINAAQGAVDAINAVLKLDDEMFEPDNPVNPEDN